MKHILLILSIMTFSVNILSQDYWSKSYDPFGHEKEQINNIIIQDGVIYASCFATCLSKSITKCSEVIKFNLDGSIIKKLQDTSCNGGWGLEMDNMLYAPGVNWPQYSKVIIRKLSKDLTYRERIGTTIENGIYVAPISTLSTEEYIISYGYFEDSTKIQDNGFYQFNGFQAWVNKETFEIDTIIAITPNQGRSCYLQDMDSDQENIYSIINETITNANSILRIIKQDRKGKIVSEFVYDNVPEIGKAPQITIHEDRLVFISSKDTTGTVGSPLIVCVDTLGNKVWEYERDSWRGIWPTRVIIGNGNNIFLLGEQHTSAFGWKVAYIACLDGRNGEFQWERVYEIDKGIKPSLYPGYAKPTDLYDLKQLDNGDIIVAGRIYNYFYDPERGLQDDRDLWLLKLDSTGCFEPNCGYVQSIKNGVLFNDTCHWLETNSKWYYTPWSANFVDRLATIDIIGDTLIGNRVFSVLGQYIDNQFVEGSELIVFYEKENEKVYFYEDDEFKLLYDFEWSKSLGDTVEYYLPSNFGLYDITSSQGDFTPDRIAYKYRNVEHTWIEWPDGGHHRIVTAEPIPDSLGNCFDMGRIIDGIGSTRGFLGGSCIRLPDGKQAYFRCFESDTLNYSEVNWECLITDTKGFNNEQKVVLYPNPSSGELRIKCDINFTTINIYDISGRQVLSLPYNDRIPLDCYNSGIYIIELKGENGIYRGKFLKQD